MGDNSIVLFLLQYSGAAFRVILRNVSRDSPGDYIILVTSSHGRLRAPNGLLARRRVPLSSRSSAQQPERQSHGAQHRPCVRLRRAA